MTDIVERLRKRVDHRIDMAASHTKTIEWEAADEIDRLREALREIAETPWMREDVQRQIARAALAEGGK